MSYGKNIARVLSSLAVVGVVLSGCAMEAGDTGASDEVEGVSRATKSELRLQLTDDAAEAVTSAKEVYLVHFEPRDDGSVEEIRTPIEGALEAGTWKAPLSEPLATDELYQLVVVGDDAPEGKAVQALFTTKGGAASGTEASTESGSATGSEATASIGPTRVIIGEQEVYDPNEPPDPGALRIASSYPGHAEGNVTYPRAAGLLRVTFEGETIDCSAMNLKNGGLRLVSMVSGVNNHNMFHGDEQDSSQYYYRGTAQCDPYRNEVLFFPPGELYGDAFYKLTFTAKSTVGSALPVSLLFKTEQPGLRIKVNQVQNHKSSCDPSYYGGYKYCDMYLLVAVSTMTGDNAVATILPDPNNYSKWEDIESGTKKLIDSPTVFASPAQTGDGVMLSLLAYDSDGDGLKNLLNGLGGALTQYGQIDPEALVYGGIAKALAAMVPTNSDDSMGTFEHAFVRTQKRWDTSLTVPHSQEDYWYGKKYTFQSGNVSVWIQSEEYPPSWANPQVVN